MSASLGVVLVTCVSLGVVWSLCSDGSFTSGCRFLLVLDFASLAFLGVERKGFTTGSYYLLLGLLLLVRVGVLLATHRASGWSGTDGVGGDEVAAVSERAEVQ
jgi:hypothetical protein